jgi:hypothetical protein
MLNILTTKLGPNESFWQFLISVKHIVVAIWLFVASVGMPHLISIIYLKFCFHFNVMVYINIQKFILESQYHIPFCNSLSAWDKCLQSNNLFLREYLNMKIEKFCSITIISNHL